MSLTSENVARHSLESPVLAALRAAADALARADHGDPFSVLGLHQDATGKSLSVRAFLPGASAVCLLDAQTGADIADLSLIHPDGFFYASLPSNRHSRFPYRLRIQFGDQTVIFDDAYSFPPILGELDVHLLAEGSHLRAFERLGAHQLTLEGVAGTAFAVWAPNARRVSVVGDFCAWDGRRLPMRHRHDCGVWEIFVPGIGPGACYKFEIRGADGVVQPLKADPVAFAAEHPPRTASVVAPTNRFVWTDKEWMEQQRHSANHREAPISIYEVHLGSWKRRAEENNRYLSYQELAEELVSYVKTMGFTHIELLPITEFPFDGSWGYQPIGLYAPTSRHGAPDDFRAFIDVCHAHNIGVLLDWVPGHFPSDQHGLACFDGTCLYEHADPRQGYHPDWNTLVYNYGRREVNNFLLGNALYWLDSFHMDGLRVDAVASMLYLDYSRKDGEWIPNRYGGKENLEAISFLKKLNELAYGQHSGAMTVAEESTAWPGVSRPTWEGGLGFGFKWNMGWMHDTLRYFSKDPIHRRHHHNDLTFAQLYQYSENFVLPLSHDEVVHGKGSLLGKMPGDRWQKFANLRAYYGFLYAHPGKKLLFMGGEFAQEREWNHDAGLDWDLLADPAHQGIQSLIRDLNHYYQATPALWELDCESAGFEWIEPNDYENSVISFIRRGKDRARPVIAIGNFTPEPRHNYRIGVPESGDYVERLNTDASCYGGCDVENGGVVTAEKIPCHGRAWSIVLTLPPLGFLFLELQKDM
ncbi:1,4-alpha-glucan branching enzyme [Azospirillaceae bacterium]